MTNEERKEHILLKLRTVSKAKGIYEYELYGEGEMRDWEESLAQLAEEEKIECRVYDGDLWVRGLMVN